jgi:hypothetical protein
MNDFYVIAIGKTDTPEDIQYYYRGYTHPKRGQHSITQKVEEACRYVDKIQAHQIVIWMNKGRTNQLKFYVFTIKQLYLEESVKNDTDATV